MLRRFLGLSDTQNDTDQERRTMDTDNTQGAAEPPEVT